MGHDSRILDRLFKAAEVLPDNVVTLRVLVDELEVSYRPADALPYAERLARIAERQRSANPGRQLETELWVLGKIRYLAGDKEGATQHWKTLPFYQRPSGEDTLKLYVEGCERRLRQYEQDNARNQNTHE